MRSQLTKHIFTACMIVFLMSFGLIFYVWNSYLARRNLSELQDKALYFSAVAEDNGWEFFQNRNISGQGENTRITIIAPDGSVLYDSVVPAQELPNHSDRIEFQQALRDGQGSCERYSESLLKKTINYAVKPEHSEIILRVSAEKDTVWILLFRMLSPMIAIVFFMIILSVLLAFFSTKTIMKPINQLDPENPDDRNIYDEMKPFVRRLIFQNQQIHRQMDQLQEEHKKQDAIRREFTANVSHELKTPLTSISGFAEIIRDGYVQEKDISHFADNIYKEAQRMIVLVNDILKLSKLESGSFEIQNKREEVDLCAVCAGIRERLLLNAKRQGVSISCYSEEAEIRIMGIANLIDEIIYNICDNAIKYNQTGGFVRIRIGREREQSEILVEIADNGIGIPEQDQERIFERFYRVNKSHSKEVGGTGLGLSIVKHGMAMHHARIVLESKEQEGTCVRLYFPG
ncbi:MAG: two-component sensor histidine kinase [Oscillospiraceae bacterium]|nr:two-component sensor histidine kinase [Oscillospiraceae bacterium]